MTQPHTPLDLVRADKLWALGYIDDLSALSADALSDVASPQRIG